MIYFLVAAAGFVLGAVFLFLIRQAKVAQLETLLSSERATSQKLQNEFRLAAADTLRETRQEAHTSLDKTRQEIAFSVSDMKARLDEYQKLVKKFEEERFQMYGRLDESLKQVLSAEQSIRVETGALKKALTAGTGVRGKLGEMMLQQILERSDLVKGISFEAQVSLSGESANDNRPDFVIFLPGGKKLAVDCKEVGGEYLLAQETDDLEEQKKHYQKLVANIRANLTKLGRKEYQALLDPEVPFVVMFIPNEGAIRAAFATDPGIFEDATAKRVILASPMTIIPLIYLISYSWQQQKIADNARRLGMHVEELGSRLFRFVQYLDDVRGGIQKAADSWDKAIGSWQTRVAPQIERTKEFGGQLKEGAELAPIDADLRRLTQDADG